MKTKTNIRQKLCRTAAFMICLCYAFGILCVFMPSLFPLLLVLLFDTFITLLPSYFLIQKEEQKEVKE